MTTLSAFNAMLKEFIGELSATFPEIPELELYKLGFDHYVNIDPIKPLNLFMNALSPYAEMIMSRDNALFEKDIDLGMNVKLDALWNAGDISEATQGAMWNYISTLFLLGSTIRAMPPDILNSVESIAKNCADKVQNGELDFASMMPSLMQSMSGLLGSLGETPKKPTQRRLE